jgi:predicted RecA/RadA family phage recombinase
MTEYFSITGIIRVREHPFGDDFQELSKWWFPEVNIRGVVIRPPRMSEKEKDRYTVLEAENQLMTAGVQQILTYIGMPSGTAILISKYFAVGTGTISATAATDTALATESFRKVPDSATQTGNQIDISTSFSTSQANGQLTNAGLFGASASGTANSGTLYTHALYTYLKTNAIPIINDYCIILSSS